MTSRQCLVIVAVLAIFLLNPSPAAADHGPSQVYGYDDANGKAIFYNYDFRSGSGIPPIDWTTHFFFYGNAHVDKVKDGLCSDQTVRQYCDTGSSQYMWVNGNSAGKSWIGFDSDKGKKQQGACGENIWREHMRIYAPHTDYIGDHSFYHPSVGYFVVGTTHLDVNDNGSCAGRAHGYSDVAENYFIASLNAVPGWSVSYECCNWFNNANSFHVAYHGTNYPHYYQNNSLSTVVHVP